MSEKAWLAVGLTAQGCFFLRFFFQWLASEKRKESVIPISFWYWSMAGCVGLLSYAIHKQDPVFMIGQSTGLIIYVRNLVLIARKKAQNPDLPIG